MIKYASFLRAINFGGKNLIKMDLLKQKFGAAECINVLTYFESGNILFESNIANEKSLAQRILEQFHHILSKDINTYLRSIEEFEKNIWNNPFRKLKNTELFFIF
jgi:uncharacterized protein (DUF1697 family)